MIKTKERGKDTAAGVAITAADTLVPDPQVWAEFNICPMTGWRWTRDPELDFPQPIKIRNRCYRSRRQIEAFKERMLRKAIAARATESEVA
jgi:hypothetical protein